MKQLLLIILALLPMLASADAVEIGGIYYNLISEGNAAEVTESPNKYTGSVVIPKTVTYNETVYSVVSIGEGAFWECFSLTSVTIPNSVTSIRDGAFGRCLALTSITIPNSVTSIGEYAFYMCNKLLSVHITDLSSWCNIAFSGYSANPLFYAHHLYLNGNEVKDLAIPGDVTSISSYAFCGCSGLVSVTIPNSVTSIGMYAFYDCSGLTSITIPNSVTLIDTYTFRGCSSLTSITIPNSVTSIRRYAFYGCSGLTSVTIPNSVTDIRDRAFWGCSGLTTITIPNSVTRIDMFAFEYCSGLTSITIPNGVTLIDRNTFHGCSGLTTVTIGSGVTSISKEAFAKCPQLKEVYCLAEKVPETSSDAFHDSYIEYTKLYIPDVSVNTYKAADPWMNFGSIAGINGDGEVQKCATPTISYADKKLTFSCTTEGVECVSEIRDADIKKHYDATISLTATYDISVYATKSGYANSDIATATLCWIDLQPRTEGISDGIADTPANAVLIQSQGGTITVQGCEEGEQVSVYGINGIQAGTSISQNGAAIVNTNLQPGSIAIVKIGNKSVKVVMK